ncbi:hypothetical protein H5410_052143 [Solanum commersonii]|uniref:ATP-dependent DNA helicase n=1 Tax=Solanum commersonii TaxID=4109 RepID=A0A9J5X2J2_SOLCO|nr:hypothetical protein H5410_052143 [Solanum commersonii]
MFEGQLYLKTYLRGLLESDNNISECLRETVNFEMPSTLRCLFATILVHCNPTDVRCLWDTYYSDMSEHFYRSHSSTTEAQIQCTLKNINYYLESMGQSVDRYDISQIKQQVHQTGPHECSEMIEEMSVKVPVEDIEAQSKLNQEQAQAFNTILERVNLETPRLFFVDRPEGTGKTFLYRALLAKVRPKGMIALASATSGVAATILLGGHTTHSRFGIPLQANETTIKNMSKQGRGAKLRQAKLIIWDEAPMAKQQTVETVDKNFCDIMDSAIPFGGKVMVFGGDFHQVLPVVPKSTRAEMIDASLFRSYLWSLMEKIQLLTNMRTKADTTFRDFVLRIGNGDESTIKDNFNCTSITNDCPTKFVDYIIERAILASRNEFVDNLNEMMIGKFLGETKRYISFDLAEDDTNNYYQEVYLNSLIPNGLPPHMYIIKSF